MRALVALSLAVLAFPASALAEVTLVTRELPVRGERMLASTAASERFNLVGLHWRGPGRVEFRTRDASGRWSVWRVAEAEPEDLPDRGTAEWRRMRGWRIGSPWWTGASDRLDVRVRGAVRRLRAHYVWSPEEESPQRSLQIADGPKVIPRRAWGANERIRRKDPKIAPRLTASIVHHTAGAAPATPAQSAAIVRGVYTYHVRGNGWDDIAYNFLVDRFGQVFEGRYGGMERNVVGAHSQGFNTGSVGVALIGNYGGARMTAAARSALTRLLAWRLDVAHVHPLLPTPFVSAGNPKYRKGTPVWLRAISGHRDTGYTSCPGGGVYGELGTVARVVAATGLPKLYTPEVEGALGQYVSFSAQLSAPLPWTVTVTDTNGRTIATGHGFGTAVQWTWDARFASLPSYRYAIRAGPDVRPVTGTLGAPAGVLPLDEVHVDPDGFTPNGDGRTDVARISYRLANPAAVRIEVQSPEGAPLASLFTGSRPAGRHSFVWDGVGYVDGRYRIVVAARGARGREHTVTTDVVLSRTLSGFTASSRAISPNGDGKLDAATVSYRLASPALARISLRRGSAEVARLLDVIASAGPQTFTWRGAVRDGEYALALTVTDAAGAVTQTLPVRVDRVPPRVRLVTPRPLRVSVSEPARVTFVADGASTTVVRPKAGTFRVVLDRAFQTLEVFAEDLAGNVSPRLRLR